MGALEGVVPQVPLGPVEVAPAGYVSTVDQAEILADVLSGIELGAWDGRIVEWMARWDTSTVLTVASWIARARGIEESGR